MAAAIGCALFLCGALPWTAARLRAAGFRGEAPGLGVLPVSVSLSCALCVGSVALIHHRWWGVAPGFVVAVLVSAPLLLALAVIDIDVHRLPDRLTAPLAALVVLGLLYADVITPDGGSLRRALAGAMVLGVGYLALALLGGGHGMGMGDVKLAPSLGALTAWPSWDVWAGAAMAAFLFGGAWGLVLILRGRGRQARLPFGPFMIAGALIALAM